MDNGKKGSTETSTSRSITIVKNCRARVQARDGTSRARARHDDPGRKEPRERKLRATGSQRVGIARTVNAAEQARHEGDEEEDTSNTHLSNASLRRGMACARERLGRGREEARGSVLTNPQKNPKPAGTIVSSLSKI